MGVGDISDSLPALETLSLILDCLTQPCHESLCLVSLITIPGSGGERRYEEKLGRMER